MDKEEILKELEGYTGSENFTRDTFNKCVYTDGFKRFMELCECYWLFSDSAILMMSNENGKFTDEGFVAITIKRTKDKAEVIFDDGNGNVLHTQKYDYTNFPMDEYEVWACRNELDSYTFMLKSEY